MTALIDSPVFWGILITVFFGYLFLYEFRSLVRTNRTLLFQIQLERAHLARERLQLDGFEEDFGRFLADLEDPLPDVRDGRVVDLEERRHRGDVA